MTKHHGRHHYRHGLLPDLPQVGRTAHTHDEHAGGAVHESAADKLNDAELAELKAHGDLAAPEQSVKGDPASLRRAHSSVDNAAASAPPTFVPGTVNYQFPHGDNLTPYYYRGVVSEKGGYQFDVWRAENGQWVPAQDNLTSAQKNAFEKLVRHDLIRAHAEGAPSVPIHKVLKPGDDHMNAIGDAEAREETINLIVQKLKKNPEGTAEWILKYPKDAKFLLGQENNREAARRYSAENPNNALTMAMQTLNIPGLSDQSTQNPASAANPLLHQAAFKP